MEIYLKITRDLSKQRTLQISKEKVHFHEKYFRFFAIFLQDKKTRLKIFLLFIGTL